MHTKNRNPLTHILLFGLFLQNCSRDFVTIPMEIEEQQREVQGATSQRHTMLQRPGIELTSPQHAQAPAELLSSGHSPAGPSSLSGYASQRAIGQSSASAQPAREKSCQERRQLLQYVNGSSFASTEELVTAFSRATDPQEVKTLCEWLTQYVCWFKEQSIRDEALGQQQIEDYTTLARIKADIPECKDVLGRYFRSLIIKIEEDQYRVSSPLVKALDNTLQVIDINVFDRDTSQLIMICDGLLKRLEISRNEFTRGNYRTHECLFSTLQSLLLVIGKLDRLSYKVARGPYKTFQQHLTGIKSAAHHYPIIYHSLLLEQSLIRLERDESQIDKHLGWIWPTLKAMAYAYNSIN